MKKRWIFLTLASVVIGLTAGCGHRPSRGLAADDGHQETPAPWDLVEEGELPQPTAPSEYDYYSQEADSATESMPQLPDSVKSNDSVSMTPPNLSRYVYLGRLDEAFNDSNKYQYAAGERIGIKPITGIADAYFTKRPLVRVKTCRAYTIEPLTHSMPYLVPEAASLLETIGNNFQDSLKKKNISGHKIKVTSLLRSAHSVKKLKRVNRNATDSSTHQLGTTFDISYVNFDHEPNARWVSDGELKYVLAEVLRDLRNSKKCMVKYEIKSPCFHITATGI